MRAVRQGTVAGLLTPQPALVQAAFLGHLPAVEPEAGLATVAGLRSVMALIQVRGDYTWRAFRFEVTQHMALSGSEGDNTP